MTAGGTVGGHETVLREMAEGLAARGWDVELLTTNAGSIYTWESVAPSGTTREGPITIRRFEALGTIQRELDRLGHRIRIGEQLEMSEQYRWVNSGMRMPGLYDYLNDHAHEYRAIVCGPYMFWACLVLADLAPERTIILPALHDEPFARLDVYQYEMRNVRGLWFETDAELELARSLDLLGDHVELVGSAVEIPGGVDVEGFRKRFGIDRDYLLFAGRREWGKGWMQLLDDLAFAAKVLGSVPPLLTCGVGEIGRVPPNVEVVDLGKLPDADRASAQAGAAASVQPSALEAFSRTVVESFLLGTPVIANAHSAVVRQHCERSGAGLTYRNRYEFVECLRLLRDEPALLTEMAKGGYVYVEENFTWKAVLDRAERSIKDWF